MGFWKDLIDATPAKSLKRANELHQAGIENVIELPSVMFNKVFDCSICKVRFGQIFAKSSIPMLVTVGDNVKLSFSRENIFGEKHNQVVLCHKCVDTFGFSPVK